MTGPDIPAVHTAAGGHPTQNHLAFSRGWIALIGGLLARAALRPGLVLALLRVAWRFRAIDWYRRFPFIPWPPREYVRWRMYTAYGDANAVPPAGDVVRYARWAARR